MILFAPLRSTQGTHESVNTEHSTTNRWTPPVPERIYKRTVRIAYGNLLRKTCYKFQGCWFRPPVRRLGRRDTARAIRLAGRLRYHRTRPIHSRCSALLAGACCSGDCYPGNRGRSPIQPSAFAGDYGGCVPRRDSRLCPHVERVLRYRIATEHTQLSPNGCFRRQYI